MIRFLDFFNHALFWYYLASNFSYLAMLIIALKTSAMHQHRLESIRLSWIKETPMARHITRKAQSAWPCAISLNWIIRN